jgi:hypothetical protein
LNAFLFQPVSEARGTGGDLIECQELVSSVSMGDAHRGATRSIGVADDALVGDIEIIAIAVEELPKGARIGKFPGIRVAGVFRQLRHRCNSVCFLVGFVSERIPRKDIR